MAVSTKAWQIGATDAPLSPQVSGLPILGSALNLLRDPLAYFVGLYHQHGPIFRIKVINREITVLAGLEANQLLNTDGNSFLSSERLFGGFADELGTDTFLVAMDGPEHQHLRKLMRAGYSRQAVLPHIDAMLHIVDDYTATLQPGDQIPVLTTLQRLVTEQLGLIMAGRRPGDYFRDLQRFLNTILHVEVLRLWPRFMLKSPQYVRSKRRVAELAREVLRDHRAKIVTAGEPTDLVDDMLAGTDINGQPLAEDALIAAVVGPYLAGIDTVASSISFFLYTVLKHPDVLQAATAEADRLFSGDEISLNNIKDMPMLHGAAIETLRMYPVAPFTPRTAEQPFTFEGYRVDAGTEVFFAQTVTHYLPEFYPNPHLFDPMRGRGKPGTYAPYTLGAHLCLGAGIAEMQMLVMLARLLHNLDLSLPSPEYDVTIHATPLPNPGRRFRVRVDGIR